MPSILPAIHLSSIGLRRMHFLSSLFDELGSEGLSSLIQLYNACKAQQISNAQIIDCLQTFGNYLPAVKIQHNKIQNEVFELTPINNNLLELLLGLRKHSHHE
jgi:hypothetical protein